MALPNPPPPPLGRNQNSQGESLGVQEEIPKTARRRNKSKTKIEFKENEPNLKNINKIKLKTWKDYSSKVTSSQYENASNENTGPTKLVKILSPQQLLNKDTLTHFLNMLY